MNKAEVIQKMRHYMLRDIAHLYGSFQILLLVRDIRGIPDSSDMNNFQFTFFMKDDSCGKRPDMFQSQNHSESTKIALHWIFHIYEISVLLVY